MDDSGVTCFHKSQSQIRGTSSAGSGGGEGGAAGKAGRDRVRGSRRRQREAAPGVPPSGCLGNRGGAWRRRRRARRKRAGRTRAPASRTRGGPARRLAPEAPAPLPAEDRGLEANPPRAMGVATTSTTCRELEEGVESPSEGGGTTRAKTCR